MNNSKRLVVLIASISIVSTAYAQSDPLTRPNGWATIPLSQSDSSVMKEYQAEAKKVIHFLKQDSKSGRRSKLLDWPKKKYFRHPRDNKLAYEAGIIAIEFEKELRELRNLNLFAVQIESSPGMPDPEYQRVAYICTMYFSGDYFGWKDLGLRLRKMYPKDELLVETLYRDCIYGRPTLAMVDMVLADIKSSYGKKLTSYQKQTRETNLSTAVFNITQKKSDLVKAIEKHEEMLVVAKREKNTEHISVLNSWISFLKTKLQKKEYRDG